MMLFALWLIWISGTESGTAQVGGFNTLEACKKAATDAVHIGAEDSTPKYSFYAFRPGHLWGVRNYKQTRDAPRATILSAQKTRSALEQPIRVSI
jgi:hypothetical protein